MDPGYDMCSENLEQTFKTLETHVEFNNLYSIIYRFRYMSIFI